MTPITVVGGGLGGLIAAITAAERGASVILHEAHHTLGGRWRCSEGPHVVHEGPHVVYGDGPLWAWLKQRRLVGMTAAVPPRALGAFWFRHRGRLRRTPPTSLIRILLERGRDAPSELSFREWAGKRFGEEAAAVAAAASGVGVFHPDPGELSAAFVWARPKRVFALPPAAKYRRGAWGEIFVDLAALARSLGVTIELGSRADTIEGVTIVATQLESARRLLGDDRLVWPSGRAALLDLGLEGQRGDPFVVSDLDGAGWLECFSIPDPSLCPPGESLFQLQVPVRADESPSAGTAKAEAFADLALPRWQDRTRFRRAGVAHHRTGAVDYPGCTWRDRPAIDRGEGIYLVGDQVAAPGLLSEVSFNSAVTAGSAAAELATGVARSPQLGRRIDPQSS